MRMQSGMPMPWYALPARYKPGNLRQPRFQFRLARRMSHRVLRHGARPAGDAREAGTRGHAGDLAQFLRSPPRSPRRRSRPAPPRRPCRPGSSAPPPCPPARDTRISCRPRCTPPGAAAPSWAPGSRSRKAAVAKSAASKPTATVIDELYATIPISSARRASTGPSSAAPLCASHATTTSIGLQPLAVHAQAESRGRALHRLHARLAHRDLAPDRRRHRVHQLSQTALQACGTTAPAPGDFGACARDASTPRVRLPYLVASSTNRGSTAVTLSSRGSPP